MIKPLHGDQLLFTCSIEVPRGTSKPKKKIATRCGHAVPKKGCAHALIIYIYMCVCVYTYVYLKINLARPPIRLRGLRGLAALAALAD